MGIFAFFNGFIYNEWFAIPLNLLPSCYDEKPSVLTVSVDSQGKFAGFQNYGYRRLSDKCVYPFGYDSRWFQSDQNLAF